MECFISQSILHGELLILTKGAVEDTRELGTFSPIVAIVFLQITWIYLQKSGRGIM